MTPEELSIRRAWAYIHFGDRDLTDAELDCVTYCPTENFREGWDSGVEYALSNQWISVDERLPEDDRYFYFVADVRINPLGVDCAEYTCETKLFSRGGKILHPTHWCEIPKLNQGKE